MDFEKYVSTHPNLRLKKSGSRGEYRGPCPFHSNDYQCFGINVDSGYWLCRAASCGLHGSFPLFYKLLEGIENWSDVRSKLDRALPIKNWEELLAFQSRGDRVPEVRYQELPPPPFQTPITRVNFPRYLANRKPTFDPEICELGFDLRLCTGGPYRNRILFPFYDIRGELLTFSARVMDDSPRDDRYLFAEGATANQFLYGVHRLSTCRQVDLLWVVEGQFDVVRLASLGEVSVGLSKGKASDRQLLDIKRLCGLYMCPAVVCLDRGAFASTMSVWAELKALGVSGFTVDISEIAKDPCELTVELLKRLKSQLPVVTN